MHLNLEYGDWNMLDGLQGQAVQNYAYDHPVWTYIRDIKYTTAF